MVQNISNILNQTKVLLKHQDEIRKIKGEDFNIFSILKMERLEVRTHSAFIATLLNPVGNHHKGDTFLKLFLQECNINDVDLSYPSVSIEYPIDQTDESGDIRGRIDILIKYKNGRTIIIENKIDAGDQNGQLKKYNKYGNGINSIYYLNLFGTNPSENSIGDLVIGTHIFVISYKNEIINWLSSCLKESTEQPILRETIKQYIILLKKITNTMDDKGDFELKKLMLQHFKEAEYIANNFVAMKELIGEEVRAGVMDSIKSEMGETFNVLKGNSTTNVYSQIWIKFKKFDKSNQFFGVESFSYKNTGVLTVGIFSSGGMAIEYKHDRNKSGNKYWPYNQSIEPFENIIINFNDPKTLLKLFTDKDFNHRFVSHIAKEVINFVKLHKEPLLVFLEEKAKSNG